MPIRLFCSYSRQDEALRQELETHLSTLKRQSLATWYDGMLEPGSNWDDRIKQELDTADIILLLVSSYFLASTYCYDTEVKRAMQRHKEGTACVIPVLLRPTDTEGVELFKLMGYPKGLKPVTQWNDRHEAYVDIVKGIRQAVQKISAQRPDAIASTKHGLKMQGFAFESVTVNEKGEIIARQTGEAKQWVEPLGDGVVLEMVRVPGGSFLMGSPREEEGREERESPQHRVAIAPFLMGKYPVTQSQYEAVMGNNPPGFQEDGANHPVENVAWEEAIASCEKLSQQTKCTYHLPSEAQWEYACRAGTITPFHSGKTITTDLANCDEGATTAVGSFPPNAFGLFDMHGNLWEWCADHWHPNYQGAPTDGSAWTTGGDNSCGVLRGGFWGSLPHGCRSAVRYKDSHYARFYIIGFRVVCSSARTL
jgi:formylglycine-generating enzyme required for sulfatase activity